MQDLLSFNRMVTPVFIHVIYWIGIVAVILAGLAVVAGGGGILKGLLATVVGLIVVRVGCEVLIVLFRINDNLAAIRNSKQM
ncbi:MAG: DUF4282 domain-containing protein [Gammaproteobacteria bacterium]|nr:DUF4282 domain-containing protein [Gammaproteobacteria bacterium]